jgi:hypothetical protein
MANSWLPLWNSSFTNVARLTLGLPNETRQNRSKSAVVKRSARQTKTSFCMPQQNGVC